MQINKLQRRYIVALALAYLLAQPALAAETTTDPWMTDRYQVEVIVFRHMDQSRTTPEQSAPAPLAASSSLEQYPGLGAVDPYANPLIDERRPSSRVAVPRVGFYLLDLKPGFPDFVALDDDGNRLDKVFARLERLDAYEPILHRAWVQPARPEDQAVPIQINSDIVGNYHVAGTITLSRERYVHLQVELDLTQAVSDSTSALAAPESLPTFGDASTALVTDQAALQTAYTPIYTLQQSRRVRGDNAQYFDHPQFGVIAHVSKIELSEE